MIEFRPINWKGRNTRGVLWGLLFGLWLALILVVAFQ